MSANVVRVALDPVIVETVHEYVVTVVVPPAVVVAFPGSPICPLLGSITIM